MRKKVALFILVCVLMSIFACGKGDSNGLVHSESNILPTRVEKINEGGSIPEGAEAAVPVDNVPEYPMLWGEWVLDVEDSYSANPTDKSIKVELDGETSYIECLPYNLEFSASWASGSEDGEVISPDGLTSKNMNLEKMESSLYYGKPLKNEKPVWHVDSLGKFAENNGYGYGIAKYREEESKKNGNKKTYVEPAYRHEREVIYSLVGDKLAIGLTEIYADEIPTETDILEVDYDIDFSGYKMTLSYGSESATYIPSQMNSTYSDGGMSIDYGGAIADEYILDNINGIYINKYNPDSNSVLFDDVHDGYIKANIGYSDDGIISIQTEDGKSYEYEYMYSGMSLTLIEGDKKGVYSAYTYKLPSQNNKPVYSFCMGDNSVVMPSIFSDLLDLGFSTEYNRNQSIMSGAVTDEIVLDWEGSSIKVKLCNPYNISVPADDCDICYMLFDDNSGSISKGDGLVINETTYDWVSFLYEPAFEKTEQSLRYKAGTNWIVNMPDWENIVDSPARLYDSGDIEIVYNFKDKILKDIRIEKPSLLYAGLQDNVDRSLLESMEPETFSGVIQVRDTILDRLRASFEQSNVDVDINETTGEIVMKNDVLFGFDQDTLSDEGKKYIDSFIGVYASVLTADEISKYIFQISFEGHTDSTGTYTYNLGLSQRRAEAVMNYCIESTANGLTDAQRDKLTALSTATGYAFTDPVFKENGEEDPEASRRAAIKFFVNVEEGNIELNDDLDIQGSISGDSVIAPNAIAMGMEGYGEHAIMILANNRFLSKDCSYSSDDSITGGKNYNNTKPEEYDSFEVEYDSKGQADRRFSKVYL